MGQSESKSQESTISISRYAALAQELKAYDELKGEFWLQEETIFNLIGKQNVLEFKLREMREEKEKLENQMFNNLPELEEHEARFG